MRPRHGMAWWHLPESADRWHQYFCCCSGKNWPESNWFLWQLFRPLWRAVNFMGMCFTLWILVRLWAAKTGVQGRKIKWRWAVEIYTHSSCGVLEQKEGPFHPSNRWGDFIGIRHLQGSADRRDGALDILINDLKDHNKYDWWGLQMAQQLVEW